MENKLGNIEPKNVLGFFEKICEIPHGSGNEKSLSDFCKEFAIERNLKFFQDQYSNIIIIKEATKGKELSETVILQAHLDMVNEKTITSNHDFEKDSLKLLVKDDYIFADQTTLGADNGIGVAYALAILDSDEIEHPRIEVIFTVEEEIGMMGAKNIDLSGLKGKFIINIDSEEEGVLTVGCAGGLKSKVEFKIQREKIFGKKYNLIISGLSGGHSGIEIDKERANANIILGRVINKLNTEFNIKIVNLSGGSKDNAIPRESHVEFILAENKYDNIVKCIESIQEELRKEYINSDSGISIDIEKLEEGEHEAIEASDAEKIITFLMMVPNGVQNMSMKISGLVETSTNLGILKTSEKSIELIMALRSSVKQRKTALSEKIECLSKYLGGKYEAGAEYPEWDFKLNSKLLDVMKNTYKNMYNKIPEVTTIHAGLECGYFIEKIKNTEAVSIGPNMYDIHTTEERISISSIKRTYEYILEVLKNI